MSPWAVSSATFLMLTALQLLFGLRGENRCTRLVSSCRRDTLSIQPKQSAWSTASDHVIVGLPDARECMTTPISFAVAWFFSSHARNSAGVSKNRVSTRCPTSLEGGAHGGNRTPDLDVRTVLLYPLSYVGGDSESVLAGPPVLRRGGALPLSKLTRFSQEAFRGLRQREDHGN